MFSLLRILDFALVWGESLLGHKRANMKTTERKLLADSRDDLVKARVTKRMKQQVVDAAIREGMSPAEAVRQAVNEWLKRAAKVA